MKDFTGLTLRGVGGGPYCCLMFFFALFFIFPILGHADQLVGDMTVRVQGQGRTDSPKEKSPPDERLLADDNFRRLTDTLYNEACITDGVMAIGTVKRDINDVTDKKLDREINYTWCKKGKQSIKKSPGPRFTHLESIRIKTYTGSGAPNHRKSTQAFLAPTSQPNTSQLERLQDDPQALMRQLEALSQELSAGTYQMSINSWVLIDQQVDQSDWSTDVCENKTTSESFYWRTTVPGQPEKTAQGSSQNGPETTLSAPPGGRGLVASWELTLDPKEFAGSTLVDESRPAFKGGYKEKISAGWSFRPAAPCDRVKNAIHHGLAYAEAYTDPGPRRQSNDSYLCYVDRAAYVILHHGQPAPYSCDKPRKPDEGAEIEIGVDGNCELQHEQEYLDKMAGQCAPEGETTGILAHEAVHVEQCRHDQQRYNSPDNDYWGDTEVRAHLAGVRVMHDWMRENCPDDILPLEQRMQRIENTWRNSR
ncbi:hypothetical protein [uncultured Desulfosarcina sp.]|uniref:hypothetical protein n=1 Tax=uncultured Desulfosarcina sp. TaxID=218289 RepID=UPI0029C99142|nr:hypothetical protein [uncultured Desulfosarcina sp.]